MALDLLGHFIRCHAVGIGFQSVQIGFRCAICRFQVKEILRYNLSSEKFQGELRQPPSTEKIRGFYEHYLMEMEEKGAGSAELQQ